MEATRVAGKARKAVTHAIEQFGQNVTAGKPYSDVKRGWEAARKLLGLEDVHLHDLRHTACSWMIAAGVDIYTVGKVVGHQSIVAAEAGASKLDMNWLRGV